MTQNWSGNAKRSPFTPYPQQGGYGQPPAQYGAPGYPQPAPGRGAGERTQGQKIRMGLLYAVGYLAIIWSVHIINVVVFGGNLVAFGIHPRDTSSLWNIVTSPLLHADFDHLLSNSVAGAIFCFLIGYSGHRVFWEVTVIVAVTAGLGIWLFGGVGTNHIGASGLVYGWLGYLLVRGIFNRNGTQISIGVLLGFMYSGLVWGLLPLTEGVSWQGHLFGALGGVLAGVFITSDDPPELRRQKEQKRQARAAAKNKL